MNDEHKPAKCRNCGETIYWQRAKSGKSYPTNSPDDRKDFHNCQGKSAAAPSSPPAPPAPATKAAPPQPLGATLTERVEALESTTAALVRQVRALGARIPLGSEDIPF